MSMAEVSVNFARSAVELAAVEREGSLPASLADMPSSLDVYRQIYVSLDLPADSGPVIGITSAITGEGRTTVALGLARTLALDLDTTILLVDADLVRPSLAARLGVPPTRGFPRALEGQASLEEVMQQVSERLFVVTSDATEADSARLLRRLSEHDPFRTFRARGAVTILDLPPILGHSYSALAASVADAIVLVIRAGVTPADTVREAIERLKDRPLRGAVLNGQRSARSSWPWRRP
jgi:Mrp family chromosome partitioning ATPase